MSGSRAPKHAVQLDDKPPEFRSPSYGKDLDLHLATVNQARIFLGMNIREQGHNRGKMVEYFQKTVDGKAQQEPWCAAFVCTVLNVVAESADVPHFFFSEHCRTLWAKNKIYQFKDPAPGRVAVWGRIGTTYGHVGICETALLPGGVFYTVEGNTSGNGNSREGDGVYRVKRHIAAWKGFELIGFLDPWTPKGK